MGAGVTLSGRLALETNLPDARPSSRGAPVTLVERVADVAALLSTCLHLWHPWHSTHSPWHSHSLESNISSYMKVFTSPSLALTNGTQATVSPHPTYLALCSTAFTSPRPGTQKTLFPPLPLALKHICFRPFSLALM